MQRDGKATHTFRTVPMCCSIVCVLYVAFVVDVHLFNEMKKKKIPFALLSNKIPAIVSVLYMRSMCYL